jgi:F-type H+-transporting ATPase subunit epsilon
MHLDILAPDKKIFSGEVTSVQVPGAAGQFQVLKNHAAIISTLIKGTVKIKTAEGEKTFDIKSGVIEVLKNKIAILVG